MDGKLVHKEERDKKVPRKLCSASELMGAYWANRKLIFFALNWSHIAFKIDFEG